MDDQYPIARTVAELINELAKLPPEAVPHSHEPPFTGVKIVPGDNGRVYIASLWNTDEGRAERAERKKTMAAA